MVSPRLDPTAARRVRSAAEIRSPRGSVKMPGGLRPARVPQEYQQEQRVADRRGGFSSIPMDGGASAFDPLAGVEGLQPPTPGFGDRCSSQLSYTPRPRVWQGCPRVLMPVARRNASPAPQRGPPPPAPLLLLSVSDRPGLCEAVHRPSGPTAGKKRARDMRAGHGAMA